RRSGWESLPAAPRMPRLRTTEPGDAWSTILPLREGALRVSEPKMFAWGRFKEDGRTDGRSSQSDIRPGSGNPVDQEDSRLRAPPHRYRCRSMMSRARMRTRRTGRPNSTNAPPPSPIRNGKWPPPYSPLDRIITYGREPKFNDLLRNLA